MTATNGMRVRLFEDSSRRQSCFSYLVGQRKRGPGFFLSLFALLFC